MTYKETDIVLERDNHFVIRVPKGFEVYENGITHATRRGIIGKYPLEKALEHANWMIERSLKRAALKNLTP